MEPGWAGQLSAGAQAAQEQSAPGVTTSLHVVSPVRETVFNSCLGLAQQKAGAGAGGFFR